MICAYLFLLCRDIKGASDSFYSLFDVSTWGEATYTAAEDIKFSS